MSSEKRFQASDSATWAALEIWAERGAQSWLSIDGNSMRPLIHDGDRVLVQHGTAAIRRGDVIVFHHGEGLAAHRVLRVSQREAVSDFLTKGDNAPRPDPSLRADRVLGRVLAVQRDGKYLRLDTAAARLLGQVVAAGTLLGLRFYSGASACKRRVLGPQPNRATAGLRHIALALYRWALRASEAALNRWEE